MLRAYENLSPSLAMPQKFETRGLDFIEYEKNHEMRWVFFLNLAFLIVPALFHMAAGAKAEFNFNKLSAGDKIQVPTNYNNHTLLKARSAFLNPNHSATRFLPRPKFLGRTRKVGPFSSQLRLVFHSSFQQKKSPSVQNIHIWLNFNFFLTKLFLINGR